MPELRKADLEATKKALGKSEHLDVLLSGEKLDVLRVTGEVPDLPDLKKALNKNAISFGMSANKTKEGDKILRVVVPESQAEKAISAIESVSPEIEAEKDINAIELIEQRLQTPLIVTEKTLQEDSEKYGIDSYNMIEIDADVAQILEDEARREHYSGEDIPRMSMEYYPIVGGQNKCQIKYLATKENEQTVNSLMSIATLKSVDPETGKECIRFARRKNETMDNIRKFVANAGDTEVSKRLNGVAIMSPSRFLGNKDEPYMTFDGKKLHVYEKDAKGIVKERTVSAQKRKEFETAVYTTMRKMRDITYTKTDMLEKEDEELHKQHTTKLKKDRQKKLDEKAALIRKMRETYDFSQVDGAFDVAAYVASYTNARGAVNLNQDELIKKITTAIDNQTLDNYLNSPVDHAKDAKDFDATLPVGASYIDLSTLDRVKRDCEVSEGRTEDLALDYRREEKETEREEKDIKKIGSTKEADIYEEKTTRY